MIAGLILAAGESSRMGQDKALLLYRGRTFLETIISTLSRAGISRIVVVLGHHAEAIQRAVRLEGVEVVVNRKWTLGQTTSLQAGVMTLSSAEVEAMVVCLVDQPLVSPDTIKKLVQAFEEAGAPVVIPTCQSLRGHPVIIGRALLGDLAALRPVEGANTVIRKYRDRTQFVEVDDRGVLLDIDDPETYRQLECGKL